MKLKPIEELKIPENLSEIIEEEGYYEDDTFAPILITIEEIEFEGKEMISYQFEFDLLKEFDDIDGNKWEELIMIYIEEQDSKLIEMIQGDSESSTCVIWTNIKTNFRSILERTIELIENKGEVERIIKNKASR